MPTALEDVRLRSSRPGCRQSRFGAGAPGARCPCGPGREQARRARTRAGHRHRRGCARSSDDGSAPGRRTRKRDGVSRGARPPHRPAEPARGPRPVGGRGRRRASRSASMPESADVLAARAASGDAVARDALVAGPAAAGRGPRRRFEGRTWARTSSRRASSACSPRFPGYDPDHGTAFSTYATPFVVGEMLAVLRGSTPVHVSRTARDLAASVEGAADAIAAAQGRPPSPAEIGSAANLDEEDVVTGLAARRALAPPAPGGRRRGRGGGTGGASGARGPAPRRRSAGRARPPVSGDPGDALRARAEPGRGQAS